MDFEWDEHKRLVNLSKHGLDFIDAIQVFKSAHVVVPSQHQSEPRSLAIGLFDGRHVTIVFTVRNAAIRVISFRRARHEERQKFDSLYGG